MKEMHCNVCSTPCKAHCQRCMTTLYCSKECQKTDWPTHKLACRPAPTATPIAKPSTTFTGTCINKPYQLAFSKKPRAVIYSILIDAWFFGSMYKFKKEDSVDQMIEIAKSNSHDTSKGVWFPTYLFLHLRNTYASNPCLYPASWHPGTDMHALLVPFKALHASRGTGHPYKFTVTYESWFAGKTDAYVRAVMQCVKGALGESCTCVEAVVRRAEREKEKEDKAEKKREMMCMVQDMWEHTGAILGRDILIDFDGKVLGKKVEKVDGDEEGH